jgi:hypothetical protein
MIISLVSEIQTENEINRMNTHKKKGQKIEALTYTPGVGGGLPGMLAAGTRRVSPASSRSNRDRGRTEYELERELIDGS